MMHNDDDDDEFDPVSIQNVPMYQNTIYDNNVILQQKQQQQQQQSTSLSLSSSLRTVRWYQQLQYIQLNHTNTTPMNDNIIATITKKTSSITMIQHVCQQYEQVQQQYTSLIQFFQDHQRRENEEDKKQMMKEEDVLGVSNEMHQHLGSTDTPNTDSTAAAAAAATANISLDPLSFLVQEETEKINREKRIQDNYLRDQKLRNSTAATTSRNNKPYIPDEPQQGEHNNIDPTIQAMAYIQLITKDLHRLPSPYYCTNRNQNHHPNVDDSIGNCSSTVAQKERNQILLHILYLFAISHTTTAGYMQGMHEIASYCLYVVEQDIEALVSEWSNFCNSNIDTNNTTSHQNINTSSRNTIVSAIAYWLTEQIITSLYIAYDVVTTTTTPSTSHVQSHQRNQQQQQIQLQQMAQRILQSFLYVDRDLYMSLSSSSSSSNASTSGYNSTTNIPYQLIFTKWIRLLFSREVTSTPAIAAFRAAAETNGFNTTSIGNQSTLMDAQQGQQQQQQQQYPIMTHAETVIFLWDALMDATYRVHLLQERQQQQQQQRNEAGQSHVTKSTIPILQMVAEYYCVARIWHYKNTIQYLQQQQQQQQYHHTSSTSPSLLLLHWFMNIPPEPIEQVQQIMQRMNFILFEKQTGIQVDQRPSSTSGTKTNMYNLPPFPPISTEILAMTQQQQQQQNHSLHNENGTRTSQTSSGVPNYFWDNAAANISNYDVHTKGIGGLFQTAVASVIAGTTAAATATNEITTSSSSAKPPKNVLSSLSETITAKTQSIQKIIVKEWEQVQMQLQQQQQLEEYQQQQQMQQSTTSTPKFNEKRRHINDSLRSNYHHSLIDGMKQQDSTGSALYNLNYYADTGNNGRNSRTTPSQSIVQNNTNHFHSKSNHQHIDTANSSPSSVRLSQQLQMNINVLKDGMQSSRDLTQANVLLVALHSIQQIQQQLEKMGL